MCTSGVIITGPQMFQEVYQVLEYKYNIMPVEIIYIAYSSLILATLIYQLLTLTLPGPSAGVGGSPTVTVA